ncbi:MAG: DUF2752 domain-containing protein [Vicinamibacteria bacterium]
MNRQLAFLWGGVALVLVAASPFAPALSDSLWACAFKSWTGLPCPTCGTARAAVALADLDVMVALSRYPLPALGWIFFLSGGLYVSGLALLGRTPPAIPNHLPIWARALAVTAVLANWMYSIATGV